MGPGERGEGTEQKSARTVFRVPDQIRSSAPTFKKKKAGPAAYGAGSGERGQGTAEKRARTVFRVPERIRSSAPALKKKKGR